MPPGIVRILSCRESADEVTSMPTIDYPEELRKSFWDKKKAALQGADDVGEALKKLEKKHQAIDWQRLASGWAKGLSDEALLRGTYEGLDKDFRIKVMPLKLEANELASAATKAGKGKDAVKPLKDAATQIDRAVQSYVAALEGGLKALELEFTQALKAAEPAAADAEDEPSSVLTDPKRLLKQLQLSKADPSRQLNFALLDDGKQDPLLAVHVRLTGRSMLNKLVKDSGIKTGAFGRLSLDDLLLLLVVEKKVAGLVKRIRIPIRACGFKIGKVSMRDESGALLEEGDEADGGEVPAAPPTVEAGGATPAGEAGGATPTGEIPVAPPAPSDEALRLAQRAKTLKALLDRLDAAQPALAAPLKPVLAAAVVALQARRFDDAGLALDAVEARVREGLGAPRAAPAAGPAASAQATTQPTGQTAADSPKVAFAKIKLQWNQAKGQLERDLEALHAMVLAEFDDAQTAAAAQKILGVTGRFNEGLADTLDDLYNAADAGTQARLRSQAATIAGNYQAYVDNDGLVAHLEQNPFMPVAIRGRLSTPLQQLRQQLDA